MSDQGPATPGTAARCEDCNRPFGGPSGCSAHERNADAYGWVEDCQRATIERLKAENASLRESLRRHQTEPDPSDPDGWIRRSALNHWAERATAAEQRAEAAEKALFAAQQSLIREGMERDGAMELARAAEQSNTALEGALRSIIIRCREGDKRTDWLPIIDGIACAALHDEERSAPGGDAE